MATMERTGERQLPRLSWGPVIAGVLLALAAHVVLGLVGAALGFVAEPADSQGVGAAAAIWALVTPFVATLLGAWLACRMAAREDTAGTNLHGVMVWCIGLLAGALFLAGTVATGAMAAGTAASGNAGAILRSANQAGFRGPRLDLRDDQAGKHAAAIAGGAAMATLSGLLGAFAGAGLARSRRTGRGLGFRIAFQRTKQGEERRGAAARMPESERHPATYPERPLGTERYPGEGRQGPSDPYPH